MDKPGFARKRGRTELVAVISRGHPATAPAQDDDLEEIKSAVLTKLALDLGKDALILPS